MYKGKREYPDESDWYFDGFWCFDRESLGSVWEIWLTFSLPT